MSQQLPSEKVQSLIRIFNQGQLQEALFESTQLLREFPHSATLHNLAAASDVGLMQFDVAIESYEYALKIDPEYAEAYFNMAIAQDNKGEVKAAIDSYKRAIDVRPNYTDAYMNMGVALQDMGDVGAAVYSYKQAAMFIRRINAYSVH